MLTFIQGWKDLPFSGYLYLSFGVSLLAILAVILAGNFLPPEVPLFYGGPTGEGQLLPTPSLLIPSIIAILVTVLNSIVAGVSKNNFLKRVLVSTTFIISLLAIITTLRIMLLVSFF